MYGIVASIKSAVEIVDRILELHGQSPSGDLELHKCIV